MAVTIAVFGATSAAACGLTANFDGLQDGGPADAGFDRSTRPGDGGDGGAPEATAEGGFCASLSTPVQFCDDFDEGQTIGAGWSQTDVYQGSTIALDNVYFSQPFSFLSSINENTAPSSARLLENVPIDTPHVHMEFEMLLPPSTGQFNFELCTLHEPVDSGLTYGVFYKYQNGNLLVYLRTLLEDGGESDLYNVIGAPPAGWLHVEIDCDVSGSGTVVVKHNGAIVVNDTDANTSTLSRTDMWVEVGFYSNDPATAIAHFDNVIIDWTQ